MAHSIAWTKTEKAREEATEDEALLMGEGSLTSLPDRRLARCPSPSDTPSDLFSIMVYAGILKGG